MNPDQPTLAEGFESEPVRVKAGRAGSRRKRGRRRSGGSAEATGWDHVGAALVFFLVVFTPWAFGTTQNWSVAVANGACFALGAVTVTKWGLRRWGLLGVPARLAAGRARERDPWMTALGAVTLLMFGLILTSVVNARADYDPRTGQFTYLQDVVSWLPHTYDRTSTMRELARWVAMACAFWGIRDWLRGEGEPRPEPGAGEARRHAGVPGLTFPPIPGRLRQLLWVLCLSGCLLAVAGLLQRAAGTSDLLFLLPSRSGKPPDAVFGPWSYRSNAAQYFNLVWPVCLGYWLWLQQAAWRSTDRRLARFDGPQILLPFCGLLMIGAVMASGSRGGAVVGAGAAAATLALLYRGSRGWVSRRARRILLWILLAIGLVGVGGGASLLRSRILAPDVSPHPTGRPVGNSPFTLVMGLRVPSEPVGEHLALLSLSTPAGRGVLQPNHAYLALFRDDSLLARLRGVTPEEEVQLTVPGFVTRFAGREVMVALVRGEGLRLYADGELLAASSDEADRQAALIPVQSTHLTVHSTSVTQVALLGWALGEAGIQEASRTPLGTLVSSASALAATQVSGEELARQLIPAEGVSSRVEPGGEVLSLGRIAAPGVLGFRWKAVLPEGHADILLRCSVPVRNLGPEPILLRVTVDGGLTRELDLQPNEAGVLEAEGGFDGPEGPRTVEVAAVDPETGGPAVLASESRLEVGAIALQPVLEPLFWDLRPQFSLESLRMRMSGRSEIYHHARRMAADHPLWGAGAGTFASLYGLYRAPYERWAAYAHDDWIETRITLGWVGLAVAVSGLVVLAIGFWPGRGGRGRHVLAAFVLIALAGCLLHARLDFPFQVYSVTFGFVLLCAIFTTLTGVSQAGRVAPVGPDGPSVEARFPGPGKPTPDS